MNLIKEKYDNLIILVLFLNTIWMKNTLNLIKSSYSASLFLNVLLKEPLIFGKFIVYLFDSILSFSYSQFFCFILVFLNFEDTFSDSLIDDKIEKLSFWKLIKICLKDSLMISKPVHVYQANFGMIRRLSSAIYYTAQIE